VGPFVTGSFCDGSLRDLGLIETGSFVMGLCVITYRTFCNGNFSM
jgi:hypothetical protein